MTNTFQISWSTPEGNFGWTTIKECAELDEAISFWMNHIIGTKDVPANATLDHIHKS